MTLKRDLPAVARLYPCSHIEHDSPRGDSNPLTCRLQIGCATVAPLGHFSGPGFPGQPNPAVKQKSELADGLSNTSLTTILAER